MEKSRHLSEAELSKLTFRCALRALRSRGFAEEIVALGCGAKGFCALCGQGFGLRIIYS